MLAISSAVLYTEHILYYLRTSASQTNTSVLYKIHLQLEQSLKANIRSMHNDIATSMIGGITKKH